MEMLEEIQVLTNTLHPRIAREWARARGCTEGDRQNDAEKGALMNMLSIAWSGRRSKRTEQEVRFVLRGPVSGRCDSLGRLKVVLPKVFPTMLGSCSLEVRPALGKEDDSAPSHYEEESKSISDLSKDKADLEDNISNSRFPSSFVDAPEKFIPVDKADELISRLRDLPTRSSKERAVQEQVVLDLPILVGEYKRPADDKGRGIGTNQLRMNLTSSVKFLEAVGITGVPVYGVQMEGPIAAISAAVMKNGVCILTVYVMASAVQKHTADQVYSTARQSLRAADD